jgi:hypothetical protein
LGYMKARAQMEQLGGTIKGQGIGEIAGQNKITDVLKQVIGMAGTDKGVQWGFLESVLRSYGVKAGVGEIGWLLSSLRGEEATSEQLAAIQAEAGLQAGGAGEVAAMTTATGRLDLKGAARRRVGAIAPGARTRAGITNQQINAGARMVGIVNQLESMATSANSAFSTLAGPTIQKAVDALEYLGSAAVAAATGLGGGGGPSK